jgi:hypothetical protein
VGSKVRGKRSSDQINFFTLTRTLKMNPALGRVHEPYSRRWTVHISLALCRRVLVEKRIVADIYDRPKVVTRNLVLQTVATPFITRVP